MNDERPADETSTPAEHQIDGGHYGPLTETDPPTPADQASPRAGRRVAAVAAGAALIFFAGAGTGVAGTAAFGPSTTSTSSAQGQPGTQGGTGGLNGNGFGGSQSNGQGFGQGGPGGLNGNGLGVPGSQGGTSTTRSTVATAEQMQGVVTIVSKLGYSSAESAGTGIVLTSSGEVLTNNHVIDGATEIEVTVESTGKTYAASVVGTNATRDVAVLQLKNASGLTTARIADGEPTVGDEVTAVGNAGGTGTLTAADGTVTALDQTITTSAEGPAEGETLHGLIETDADVVSGDSGGPLQDADGDVIGIDTAASSGTSDTTGYAIPIGKALDIATQILSGDDTDEITIGLPAFLGVALSSTGEGATIGAVYDDTPAATAGIAEGDTITRVGDTPVSSIDQLRAAIATHEPGDSVRITWTDTDGGSHSATVTLIAGPAD